MFFNFRNPESVYKPSRDQMAEMVKVVMMNQDTIAPIPVQFNSAILHVLEAYQELREELSKNEAAIEELKQSHAKDINDFEALAKHWENKEKDYKTELKNLEVLLSRTEGGMEKVTLARTKSTVHGSVKASESIGSMISTIKERNAARHSRNRGWFPPNISN
jgi:chromosome segregation ATPase